MITRVSKIFSKLRRTTSSRLYIPEIDGLRFVAIFAVFLYHLTGYLLTKTSSARLEQWQDSSIVRVTNQGYRGVDLFFVLSGFILVLPFLQPSSHGVTLSSLKSFYLRRVRRIEPPYIISLFILAVLRFYFTDSHDVWRHLLASIFYMNNLIYTASDPINAVCWSLEIEIQFYLLVPLICWLLYKWTRVELRLFVIFGAIIFFSFVKFFYIAPHTRLELSLLGYMPYFLSGIFLAQFLEFSKGKSFVASRGWDILGVFAFFGIVFGNPSSLFDSFGLNSLLAVFIWCSLSGPSLRSILSMPFLTTIGGMCYSIYLFHYQVISAMGRITLPVFDSPSFALSFLPQVLVVGIPTLVVCGAYFIFVEKPFMSHSQRNLKSDAS